MCVCVCIYIYIYICIYICYLAYLDCLHDLSFQIFRETGPKGYLVAFFMEKNIKLGVIANV
jgi:hypothetical protein